MPKKATHHRSKTRAVSTTPSTPSTPPTTITTNRTKPKSPATKRSKTGNKRKSGSPKHPSAFDTPDLLRAVLSLRMPRCSVCSTDWFDDDYDEPTVNNTDTKITKTTKTTKTQPSRPTKRKKQTPLPTQDEKIKRLVPMPRCECSSTLISTSPPIPSPSATTTTNNNHQNDDPTYTNLLEQALRTFRTSTHHPQSPRTTSTRSHPHRHTTLSEFLSTELLPSTSLRRYPKKGMCQKCLASFVSSSSDVLELDYRSEERNVVRFSVDMKCPSCRQKFGPRGMRGILRECEAKCGTKDRPLRGKPNDELEDWWGCVGDTLRAVRFLKRLRRTLRNTRSRVEDTVLDPNGAVAEWLNGDTSDRSSDGCFSSLSDSGSGSDDDDGDSDGDGTKRTKKEGVDHTGVGRRDDEKRSPSVARRRRRFIEARPGEIQNELLRKDPKFRQELEDHRYILNASKTEEGRRELGLVDVEQWRAERKERLEQEERDKKMAEELQRNWDRMEGRQRRSKRGRAKREMKNLADFLGSSRDREEVREVQVVQEEEEVQVVQEEEKVQVVQEEEEIQVVQEEEESQVVQEEEKVQVVQEEDKVQVVQKKEEMQEKEEMEDEVEVIKVETNRTISSAARIRRPNNTHERTKSKKPSKKTPKPSKPPKTTVAKAKKPKSTKTKPKKSSPTISKSPDLRNHFQSTTSSATSVSQPRTTARWRVTDSTGRVVKSYQSVQTTLNGSLTDNRQQTTTTSSSTSHSQSMSRWNVTNNAGRRTVQTSSTTALKPSPTQRQNRVYLQAELPDSSSSSSISSTSSSSSGSSSDSSTSSSISPTSSSSLPSKTKTTTTTVHKPPPPSVYTTPTNRSKRRLEDSKSSTSLMWNDDEGVGSATRTRVESLEVIDISDGEKELRPGGQLRPGGRNHKRRRYRRIEFDTSDDDDDNDGSDSDDDVSSNSDDDDHDDNDDNDSADSTKGKERRCGVDSKKASSAQSKTVTSVRQNSEMTWVDQMGTDANFSPLSLTSSISAAPLPISLLDDSHDNDNDDKEDEPPATSQSHRHRFSTTSSTSRTSAPTSPSSRTQTDTIHTQPSSQRPHSNRQHHDRTAESSPPLSPEMPTPPHSYPWETSPGDDHASENVDPAALSYLVNMGFKPSRSRIVLRDANNNTDLAIRMMLSESAGDK